MGETELYKKILSKLVNKEEYKIAFIGDSITSAEWVHPNWRDVFEYILKFAFEEFKDDDWWIPEWNLKFFNYALDGASSDEFKENVIRASEEVNPDLYIILGTANDLQLNIPVEKHIQNFKEIFEHIEQNGKDLIFSPSIYSKDNNLNEKYLPYVDEVMKLGGRDNQRFVNGYEIYSKFDMDKLYTLDLVHPNALGNVYIAKMFLEEAFGISVNPEKYLEDLRTDTIKYPKW